MKLVKESLSASEAVYGFAGWLTSRDKKVTMSGSDDAAVVAELVGKFIEKQKLEQPKDHWEDDLIPMKESMEFTRGGDIKGKMGIGDIKKAERQEELKKLNKDYKDLKSFLKSNYYDPIDYPGEYKQQLSNMSYRKGVLRRQIDPEKAKANDKKAGDKWKTKFDSNDKLLKDIKKEIQILYPDIKIAINIVEGWKYGKNREKTDASIEASPFENISAAKRYVITANAAITKMKKKVGAVGQPRWY